MSRVRTASLAGLAAGVSVVLLVLLAACGAVAAPEVKPGQAQEATDPVSGLAWIDESDLPPEAVDTLELIDAGGPYPYDKDGSVFGNREGLLPDAERGYYHEFTVDTPGSPDRGARRIVTGSSNEFYWTSDHYASFERIRRDS